MNSVLSRLTADIDRWRIVHVDDDARNLRELRPKLLDHLVDAQTLVARLEADQQSALVGTRDGGATSDGRVEAGDVRVGSQDLVDLPLVRDHVVERRALRGLRRDE